jgi:1-acyl-sn-glycerol-3-phosphate acyltransferase
VSFLKSRLAWLTADIIIVFARFITAVHAKWEGCEPRDVQRVYFANHCSHGDFVLLWTVLPPKLRRCTRPVAGADYWLTSPLKRFIGCDVFRAVLIERQRSTQVPDAQHRGASINDPVGQMADALDGGDSLIVFPEGTRNTGNSRLLPFKSGLYHLATMRPKVELVPVWINNLNRVLPKGEVIPVPLVCSVTFGKPLTRLANENKANFLSRAEQSLLALAMVEAGLESGLRGATGSSSGAVSAGQDRS